MRGPGGDEARWREDPLKGRHGYKGKPLEVLGLGLLGGVGVGGRPFKRKTPLKEDMEDLLEERALRRADPEGRLFPFNRKQMASLTHHGQKAAWVIHRVSALEGPTLLQQKRLPKRHLLNENRFPGPRGVRSHVSRREGM